MQATINFKKKISKKKHKKWGHPLSWLVIGDGNSTSVYNDPKYLASSLAETEPHTAITNQSEETKEKKIVIEKNLRKAIWNSKILKERMSWLMMLVAIRDDIWNVVNMQHTIPNSKRWDYSDIPDSGHE